MYNAASRCCRRGKQHKNTKMIYKFFYSFIGSINVSGIKTTRSSTTTGSLWIGSFWPVYCQMKKETWSCLRGPQCAKVATRRIRVTQKELYDLNSNNFEQFVIYLQVFFEVNSNGLYITPEDKEDTSFLFCKSLSVKLGSFTS